VLTGEGDFVGWVFTPSAAGSGRCRRSAANGVAAEPVIEQRGVRDHPESPSHMPCCRVRSPPEQVRVRRLTDQEGQRLQQIVRRGSTNSVRYRRAMMVLASAGGNRVPVIAKLVAADEDTVR
jgi:hypothetical protein